MSTFLIRPLYSKKLVDLVQINWRSITTKQNREKMNRDKKKGPTFDSDAASLASKGFLRPQKEYSPPSDVLTTIDNIFSTVTDKKNDSKLILSNEEKFKLLSAISRETGHSVPNSLLSSIKNLDNIRTFYTTPVNTTLPMDRLKKMDLPANLHIIDEYTRFNPATDTMFNGVTAFQESSTLVTGLKYKKKYPGHIQTKRWLF